MKQAVKLREGLRYKELCMMEIEVDSPTNILCDNEADVARLKHYMPQIHFKEWLSST